MTVGAGVGWKPDGTAVVEGTRIATKSLAGMHTGEGSVERLAELYEIPVAAVEAAVEYERVVGLAAAAVYERIPDHHARLLRQVGRIRAAGKRLV